LRPALRSKQLAFEKEIADFAHRALAAGRLGDEVRARLHAWMRIGDRYRKACSLEERQVRRVIAHAGDGLGSESKDVEQFVQRCELVLHALAHPGDAELAHALLDRARLAAGNHRDLQSSAQHLHDSGAVAHMEALEVLPAPGEIQASVGQYAVDVQHQEAHVAGSFHQRIHHITPARSRSCTLSAPISTRSSSTTSSCVMRAVSSSRTASAASTFGWIVYGCEVITSRVASAWMSARLSSVRRRSPSV